MSDIDIRTSGRSGRITLRRPKALNALTYDMVLSIEKALDEWRSDDDVDLVIIDAEGEKAFCAGGDIAELYATGKAGDYAYGRRFWADEYRVNAKIAEFPKPFVAFMQGFAMGGGVGVACHGSHRIVGDTSRIAMPECGIGLVPDVGGSLLLAQAPGRSGEYLGATGARMNAADAIYAGFADVYLPEAEWPGLIADLETSGDAEKVARRAVEAPAGALAGLQSEIDRGFSGKSLADILDALESMDSDFARDSVRTLKRNSPLSCAVTIEMTRRMRGKTSIRDALELEYRYTFRAMQHGDFLEGVRAQIIDKDRNPHWRHQAIGDLSAEDVSQMLAPLGENSLNLEEQST